jgi:hypothetical protein
VGIADQVADRGLSMLAERQLAGRRRRQTHLVLEPGDVDAVALTGYRRLGIGHELRYQEQA